MWSLDSGLPWESPLHEHLTRLCELLAPKHEALRELADEDHGLDWFCFVEVASGQGGVTFEPDLLRRLAELPAALALDIYANSEPDDECR